MKQLLAAKDVTDALPTDEGIYLVNYDFNLLESLDSGFSVEKFDNNARTYTCIPRDFPRAGSSQRKLSIKSSSTLWLTGRGLDQAEMQRLASNIPVIPLPPHSAQAA